MDFFLGAPVADNRPWHKTSTKAGSSSSSDISIDSIHYSHKHAHKVVRSVRTTAKEYEHTYFCYDVLTRNKRNVNKSISIILIKTKNTKFLYLTLSFFFI